MMTDAERVTRSLRALARKRAAAEQRAADLRAETDALIVTGNELGIPKRVLAREAGLTRQTIYSVLLRAGVGA